MSLAVLACVFTCYSRVDVCYQLPPYMQPKHDLWFVHAGCMALHCGAETHLSLARS